MERNKQVSDILTKIVSDYFEDLNPPEFLYHYTSIDGLHGIISEKSIWASNLHYLNDSQEFMLGIRLACEFLEKKKNETVHINNPALTKSLESLKRIKKCPVYAVSFTEEKDDLSHWRGYCPPQGGYGLGFSYQFLRVRAKALGFLLYPCVYISKEQERLVNRVIDKAFSEFEEKQVSNDEDELDSKLEFLFSILPIASLLKNSSFKNEKEWRLVSIPIFDRKKDIKYRPYRFMFVPYIEFILAKKNKTLKLDKIIIGPNSSPGLAELSIKGFLKSESLEKTKVEMSQSSYRDF